MTTEVALALLSGALTLVSLAVPVTALILRRSPKNGEGKYVTVREFDNFRAGLGDTLLHIKCKFEELDRRP